jgi:hypothetical protein
LHYSLTNKGTLFKRLGDFLKKNSFILFVIAAERNFTGTAMGLVSYKCLFTNLSLRKQLKTMSDFWAGRIE